MRLAILTLALCGSCSLTNVGKNLQQSSCDTEPFAFCDELNNLEPTGDSCRVWRCDPARKVCAVLGRDRDQDTVADAECARGDEPIDCNDDPADKLAVYQGGGLPEQCDGIDNDCDGVVDDGAYTPGPVVQLAGANAALVSASVAGRRRAEDPRIAQTAVVLVSGGRNHTLLTELLADLILPKLLGQEDRIAAAVATYADRFMVLSSVPGAAPNAGTTVKLQAFKWRAGMLPEPEFASLSSDHGNPIPKQTQFALAASPNGPEQGILLSQPRTDESSECFKSSLLSEIRAWPIRSAPPRIGDSALLAETFETYPASIVPFTADTYVAAYQARTTGTNTEIRVSTLDVDLVPDVKVAISSAGPVGEAALAVRPAKPAQTMPPTDPELMRVALVYRDDCQDRDADTVGESGETSLQLKVYEVSAEGGWEQKAEVEVARFDPSVAHLLPRRPAIFLQEVLRPDGRLHSEWQVAWEDGSRKLLMSRFTLEGLPIEQRLELIDGVALNPGVEQPLTAGARLVPGAGSNGVTAMSGKNRRRGRCTLSPCAVIPIRA